MNISKIFYSAWVTKSNLENCLLREKVPQKSLGKTYDNCIFWHLGNSFLFHHWLQRGIIATSKTIIGVLAHSSHEGYQVVTRNRDLWRYSGVGPGPLVETRCHYCSRISLHENNLRKYTKFPYTRTDYWSIKLTIIFVSITYSRFQTGEFPALPVDWTWGLHLQSKSSTTSCGPSPSKAPPSSQHSHLPSCSIHEQ